MLTSYPLISIEYAYVFWQRASCGVFKKTRTHTQAANMQVIAGGLELMTEEAVFFLSKITHSVHPWDTSVGLVFVQKLKDWLFSAAQQSPLAAAHAAGALADTDSSPTGSAAVTHSFSAPRVLSGALTPQRHEQLAASVDARVVCLVMMQL